MWEMIMNPFDIEVRLAGQVVDHVPLQLMGLAILYTGSHLRHGGLMSDASLR